MFLLDTNILSNILRKAPDKSLMERLRASPPETFFTSCICVMELRHGASRLRNGGQLWGRIQKEVLSRVSILTVRFEEAVLAGDLLAHLRNTGTPVGVEDVLIGATALARSLTVVTDNVRHLRRIPNLRLENWLRA